MVITTTKDFHGKKVLGGRRGTRTMGKITRVVFHSDELRLVGFLVRRPDIAFIVKRPDGFVAYDSLELRAGSFVVRGDAAWDDEALRRLGISLEDCYVWEDMPLVTEDGFELGRVGNIEFDAETGIVKTFLQTDGHLASLIDGTFRISAEDVVGYRGGFLVVASEVANYVSRDGLAAAAGRGFARATHKATEAKTKTAEVVDKGVYALGGIIGDAAGRLKQGSERHGDDSGRAPNQQEANVSKQDIASSDSSSAGEKAARAVGKQISRTRGMFKSFRDEFERASADDDESQTVGGQ